MLPNCPDTKSALAPSSANPELSSWPPHVIVLFILAFLGLVLWTTNHNLQLCCEALCILTPPVIAVWFLRQSSTGNHLLHLGLLAPRVKEESNQDGLRWWMLGLFTILLGICILETSQPLYFTQDDSLANGVVGMVVGCRSLANGQFPAWNPAQYLGSPMASMSYWSLTYPPTYLSYAFARHVLGNEWWTMEVYQV